jgi:hypothetical protein
MIPAGADSLLAGCAEARRLIGLANQHLRVLNPEAARALLQCALDALPTSAKKSKDEKRSRSNT